MTDLTPKQVIELIRQAFYLVYNRLDYGFLESVYRNALVIELRKLGLHVVAEPGIPVFYDGVQVGFFRPDLIVNGCVVVEIKALASPSREAFRQIRNYLRCSLIEYGMVLNFGREPYWDVEHVPVRGRPASG